MQPFTNHLPSSFCTSTDASGAPLYAPYPLSIAIPAMMIGHLTIAGLAELVITAGVVAYLQKSDPALLKAEAAKNPQPDLHIRGDKDVRYERVAQAMASAQQAGLRKIGFITEPKR